MGSKKAWKRKIIEACKTAGTYETQFDAVVDELAAILERRDDTEAAYLASGGMPVLEYTNKFGATNLSKNPALVLWDSLNHSALEHWRELGLTPASYKKLTGDGPVKEAKKKGLAEMIMGAEESG